MSSMRLARWTQRRSPFAKPRARSALATRLLRRSISAKVKVSPAHSSATSSARAARERSKRWRRFTGGCYDTEVPSPRRSGERALSLHLNTEMQRRYHVGDELVDGGAHFRVWAPSRRSVAVVIDGRDVPLDHDGDGYFAGLVDGARAGTL